MQQRPENFNAAGEDPEATLVTPRFDEDEARRAHPVVPLNEAPYPNTLRTVRARGPRRSWTPALLAVVLLAVAALGGALAMKVMQSPRAEQTQATEPTQEQTQPAPAQTAEAPSTRPSTPAPAEVTREETTAAKPATREIYTRHERAAVAAPVAAEPVREVADDDDREARGRASEKRREHEHEDETEKEMRKASKPAKGKAPRLVDVLTPSH